MATLRIALRCSLSDRYGQDVAISEDTSEVVRRHTEKVYGQLRDGEVMSGICPTAPPIDLKLIHAKAGILVGEAALPFEHPR